jgi:hypothetical protein
LKVIGTPPVLAEDIHRQNVFARTINGRRVEAITRVQGQSFAQQRFMDALQALYAYFANIYLCTRFHVIAQVEHRRFRRLKGDWRIHLGECVPLLLQGRQQARCACQHGLGDGRLAAV